MPGLVAFKKVVPVVVAVCLAAVCSPALAGAEEPRVWSQFQLEASKGFEIAVERDGSFFSLTAAAGPTGVIYSTLSNPVGDAEPMSVEADLGKLGDIAVHFEAAGPPKRVPNQPPGCIRARTKGHFVGSIRFRGELDYTRAEAARAAGTVTTSEGDCDTFDRADIASVYRRKGGPPAVGLVATRKARGGTIRFACNRGEGLIFASDDGTGHPQRRYFEAAIDGQYRQLNIIRIALSASDRRGSFAFDESLDSATASPPPPFRGAATYRRRDGSRRGAWAGSLSVSFPGAPHIRLAGPGFDVSMEYDEDE